MAEYYEISVSSPSLYWVKTKLNPIQKWKSVENSVFRELKVL